MPCLRHSDVAPCGRSDVTCSALSRAKRTSLVEAKHHARRTHHVPRKRNTSFHQNKNRPSAVFVLVETAVFETASENPSSGLSPSAADSFILSRARQSADSRMTSFVFMTGYEAPSPVHVLRLMTPCAGPRKSPSDGSALRLLLKQSYCCRLFLRLRCLRSDRISARLPRLRIPVEILSSPWENDYIIPI